MTKPVLLVLRALGLGDFLTAVPAFRALAEAFPDHHRVLAAPAALAPLAGLTGATHDVIATAPLAPVRYAGPVDVAVNLHGRGPESTRLLLALAPRRLIAFSNLGIPETHGMPTWHAGEHEVERWCRLLTERGIGADPRRLDLDPPAGYVPAVARGATLIHPGAASVARCWPVERWASVARHELAEGRRVVLTGTCDDRERALEVARLAHVPDDHVLAGTTDLAGLARLVGAADRVVCADTGVAHLATALCRPSVVIFGASSPAEWGPPRDRPWHRVLWAGRTGPADAPQVDAGLLKIWPRHVLSALSSLPAAPRAWGG